MRREALGLRVLELGLKLIKIALKLLDFLAHVIGTAFKLEALILATKACDGKLHFFVLLTFLLNNLLD